MALPILDGNQSATTLSTILSGGQHITAHTVVSLGTQAITDMRGAVSGSVVSISNLPSTQTIAGTVTANLASVVTINSSGASYSQRVVSKSDLQFTAIAGAIDISRFSSDYTVLPVKITSETDGLNLAVDLRKTSQGNDLSAISNDATAAFVRTQVVGGSVTIGSLPALVAGTAQIGSVTASISNSVTIASLPAISGTVTANTFALQGTAVTTSNFTSTTASTVLANYNATREVLTIFNEGAGNLHICAGATCTTIAYQVRLSAGDYYEVPNHQTTITHSAVFATAGTARVTEVS